jgi:single-stranded DNA-specific DHH superfamily exonuclease
MQNSTTGHAFDVFNGDADGICALHQLRLAEPCEATLVTGIKREIALLQRVQAKKHDRIVVLDISFDSNLVAIRQQLDAGAQIIYFDHHSAAQAFQHPGLTLHLDDAPDVCTSLLVNRYLNGKYASWANVGAFGDNLIATGYTMAQQAGFTPAQAQQLLELGTLLNYNAYGEKLADLHVHPAQLYQDVHAFSDPFACIAESNHFQLLQQAYTADMSLLDGVQAFAQQSNGAIYRLPDAAWARRVSGLLANRLTEQSKEKSFAVLTENEDGSFVASVRSAHPDSKPASEFCLGFTSGGGRRGSGGINALPAHELEDFSRRFFAYF